MAESVVFEKSKAFSIRIINLYKHLCENKNEYVLLKQLLRSGTSIGANIAEAECAFSKKIFLLRCTLPIKNVPKQNTGWNFFMQQEYLTQKEYDSILFDCTELMKLLTAITKTTRNQIDT